MNQRDYFLKRAEEASRPLFFETVHPREDVSGRLFDEGDSVTLDFGTEKTYTGLSGLSDLVKDFQTRYFQKDIAEGDLMLSQISSTGTTTSTLALA